MDPENQDDVLELDGFQEDEAVVDALDEEQDGQQEGDQQTEDDNAVIRRMRAELRATKREAAELRKKATPSPADIGERPRYGDGSKWDFSEEKYEEALDDWMKAKLATPAKQPEPNDMAQEFDKRAARFTAIELQHRADPVKARALDDVTMALSPDQLAVVTYLAAEKGPDVLLQIASDPDVLDRVADMTNPIELAAEIGRMTAGALALKKAPDIDRPVRGGRGAPAVSADKMLEKLEKEAERTGNRTKLIQYRKAMRDKGKDV